jgi:aspartyl-tRNA(Asn)/glutamyl-tRNA(Gln) amidotransferase subunit A
MTHLKPVTNASPSQFTTPPTKTELAYTSIGHLSQAIRQQMISPVEVVQACLKRIETLNPRLNAFIMVLQDEALEQARIAETEILAGRWRGPLHGIPVGIKDMFDTAGIRTTAGFEHFQHRIPSKDAVAVSTLKDAGAIIIGKMNMHTLAMGTTSAQSYFGAVHNPWNLEYIAGGSSGGSAAAIAAGLCYATLDTDAIGSCRLPAACCGVTGFKGTFGLVNNAGILEGEPVDEPILWLSHAALTTRSAEDAAMVLSVLAEPGLDSDLPLEDRSSAGGSSPQRVGVVSNFVVEQDIRAAFDTALEPLRHLNVLTEIIAPLETPGFDVQDIQADRQAIAATLFEQVELLLLPTTTAMTPSLDAVRENPMAVSAQNTLFANYYGLPAISVPCGFDRHGLPIGLQIVGRPGGDQAVLRLARQYQQQTTWSERHPQLEA